MEHRYRIGLRTIKTGLAVTISIFMCRIFHAQYPFYAVIATIISMDKSIVNSIKAGKNRMLGTTLGAILGISMVLIQPGSAILTGLAVTILIYICNLRKWNGSIVISGTVVAIIMFNLNGRDPLIYALSRLFDTFIGIAVAVCVNIFVAPQDFEKKIIEINLEIHREFDHLLHHEPYDLKLLDNKTQMLEQYIKIYENEFRFQHRYKEEIAFICEHAQVYQDILTHMESLQLALQDGASEDILAYHERRAQKLILREEGDQ